MLFLEDKYVNLLSYRLENFKKKDDYLYNFRCPICGDSQNKRTRSRGYIHPSKRNPDALSFTCHNCSSSLSFRFFLKKIDEGLYLEYSKECLQERRGQRHALPPLIPPPAPKLILDPYEGLTPLLYLDIDHPARVFIQKRALPHQAQAELFYTDNFFAWARNFRGDKTPVKRDEPRVVIPFLDEKRKPLGFQGRTLGNNSTKYISVILEKKTPFVYGLHLLDFARPVYVFEGPFDAMFLQNCLSTGGGDIVGKIRDMDRKPENFVVVFDNEPRKPHTTQKIAKAIEQGFKVVIWPDSVHHKDLNDCVLAGMSPWSIKEILETSTYSGLEATVWLTHWKHC